MHENTHAAQRREHSTVPRGETLGEEMGTVRNKIIECHRAVDELFRQTALCGIETIPRRYQCCCLSALPPLLDAWRSRSRCAAAASRAGKLAQCVCVAGLRAWVVGIDGLGHPYIRSISSIAKATDTAYHRQTSNACRLVFIQMQHEMGWGKAHQAADGVCLGLAGEDGIHVGATGWIMFARNSSNVT